MITKGLVIPPNSALSLTAKSFLYPPDHPRYYTYELSPPAGSSRFLFQNDGYSDIREIDAQFHAMPFEHERTIIWTAVLYHYFQNQYSIDGKSLTMQRRYFWNPETPRPSSDYHVAVVFIRKFYPTARAKLNWIEAPPPVVYDSSQRNMTTGWERGDGKFQIQELLRQVMFAKEQDE